MAWRAYPYPLCTTPTVSVARCCGVPARPKLDSASARCYRGPTLHWRL